MENTHLAISDIKNIENSYISILAMHKNDKEKHTIVYWDTAEKKIIKLFDSDFGRLYHDLVFDFAIGYTVGAIVGLARERKGVPELISMKILVGGLAFSNLPRLWREFSADGYAANLMDVTAQCDAWWEAA